MWLKASRVKTDRKIFAKVIGYLIDAANAKAALRLKVLSVPEPEIDKYLIRPSYELSEAMLKAMVTAEDLESAIHAIRITTVGQVLSKAMDEIRREGVDAVERALDKGYLDLCKQMELLHQFSVAPILAYIAQKESEFRSLRKCLRLKADGFKPEEIKKAIS